MHDDDVSVKRALLKEYSSQLETFDAEIHSLAKAPTSTTDFEAKRRLSVIKREIKRLQAHLPIYARRADLIKAVHSHRTLVLKADTGSGKSTQFVQYLVDAGFADQGTCKRLRCLKVHPILCRTNCLYSTTSAGCSSFGSSRC